MAILPQRVRSLTPVHLRDDVRLRAFALTLGLIPPRSMHSHEDARLLRAAAQGARRVVEIGVYEGASALLLLESLQPGSELHLIDPFGHHRDALPQGWGASERATRSVVARALRTRGDRAPRVRWHVATSEEVAAGWSQEVDLVFIDGDHSEETCERDWMNWSRFVAPDGAVVFHDARAELEGGRGLPGPSSVVRRHLREGGSPGWGIVSEGDRTVVVRRCP